MYRIRYIERIGTPGRMLSLASKEELVQLSAGCKLYKNGFELTEPKDGCTCIVVPKGGGGPSQADLDTMQRGGDNLAKVNEAASANSVRGSKNQFREGRVPIVLGEHLLVPDLIGKPYTTYGKDNGETQYLHQLFCLGYNNVDYIESSAKIGDLPIALTGSPNRAELNADTTYYDRLVSEQSVGERIQEDGEVVRVTTDNTTEITVGISFPSGLRKYDNTNAEEDYTGEEHLVKFTISCQKALPKSHPDAEQTYESLEEAKKKNQVLEEPIQGDTDCIRKAFSFAVSRGTYKVTIQRSKNSKEGDYTYQDHSYWDFLQSDIELMETDVKGNVAKTITSPITNEALKKLRIVSLRIKASDTLHGVVDEFNVVARSTCLDYMGKGSGRKAWAERVTRNPASLLLYVLTNPHINRKPLKDSEIEWAEFEAYWQWCKQNNFCFDAVFTDEHTIWEIANMITRASMAALTLYNGTYGITIDKAVKNRVDFHLTPKNTIGSTQMTKPFTGTLKNLKCKFVDRTTGYAEDESLVSIDKAGNILYDQGEQEGDTQEATFRGITDSTQLRRVGRFELLKATRRVVTYSVQQDWEYLTAFPGAVGYLANDMLLYGIKSGRIRSVDHDTEGRVTQVGLDENVLFEEGKSYSLVVRHNNQEEGIQTYHVRRDETQGNYVTLSLPAKANLQPGNLYTFSERGKEAMQVLCTSITPSGDHSATLELVEYCPEIYTMDDKLPPWNSFITIPNEQSNPGWEKEVLPYIPPAKPGQPAKDVRLTTSEATVHSSSRGILQGKNITLECKLFNLVHAPKAEISSPAEPDESDKNGGSTETGESGETETLEPPAHTTIVWNHSDDLALTDTDNPLVKVLDLQVDKNLTDEENAQAQKNLEYIRKHTSFAIGVNFTDKDGTQYQDSVSIPVIYDGLNCEYLGAFNTLPEATVKGEPLLVGDWFLVEKTFSIKTDGEIVQGDITTNDGGKDNKGEGIVYRIADVYEYMGDGCWKESLDSSKIAQTLNDMLDLEPCEADVQAKDGKMLLQRLAANQAFIHKLVAQTITIPVDGAIESSGFSDEGTGFRLDGDGSFTAKDAELRGVFRGGQGLHKPARISAIETIGLSDISYKDPSQHIFVAAMDDEKGRNLSVRCYSTKEDNYTCGIILRVTEIQEVSYPYQNSQQKAHIKTLEYSFNKGETWQDLDSWYIWPPWLDDISAETWIDMHGSIGPFSLYVRNLQQFDAGTQWKFSYGNLKGISVQKSNGEEYFSAKDGVVTASKFVTPPGGKVDSAKDNHPIQVGSKNSDHLRIYDDGITRVNADGNLTTLYFQGGSKNDAPISGYTQFCGGVGVAGRVVITGDLEVRGNVTFKKNLTVSGKLTAEDTSNSLKGAKAN